MSRGGRRQRRDGLMVDGAGLGASGRDGRRQSVHARGFSAGASDKHLALRLKHPVDPKRRRRMRGRNSPFDAGVTHKGVRAEFRSSFQGASRWLTRRLRTCAGRRLATGRR